MVSKIYIYSINSKPNLKVIFYWGKQAGVVCLLTLLASGVTIVYVIAEGKLVKSISETYNIPVVDSNFLNSKRIYSTFNNLTPDLFICVHGKKYIKSEILDLFPLGGINVHPCLYKYKGAKPINRLLRDGETKASVGVHRMTEKIDGSEVVEEVFIDVSGCKSVVEVYNKLYPIYAIALKRALDKLNNNRFD